MFEQSFVQTTDSKRRTSMIFVTFMAEIIVVLILIIIPLIYF